MKNRFLSLLVCLLLVGAAHSQTAVKESAPQAKTAGYSIKGLVQGLGAEEVSLVDARNGQVVAKTKAKDGVFVLEGAVPEPAIHQLFFGAVSPEKQSAFPFLFLENNSYRIAGTKTDTKNLKVEGGPLQKDFTVFQQTFNPLFQSLNKAVTDINGAPEAKKPALMKAYSTQVSNINNELVKFISARRNSPVSLFAVSVTLQAAETITDVEKRFGLLSESLRNSVAGKEVESYIAQAKIGAIGTDAMDFTQNDVNETPVSLSSFKGKYVLVDFWASWCRPCRAENPNVVKVYNKFKDRNFTVLGVSLDQQKAAWVSAIEKDKLTWTQVSDLQFWNNAAAQLYKVQSIPQNFLIDPAGKIVAKDLRGSELEKKLCEYLGCSN